MNLKFYLNKFKLATKLSTTPSNQYCSTCGTLIPLNISNPLTNPLTNGFPSGTYLDGSILFPGSGAFTIDCSTTWPSRISYTAYRFGPGAYSTCGGPIEIYDIVNPKYICNHPNLVWLTTNGEKLLNLTGRVQIIRPDNVKMNVVRINITRNGQTYQQIGWTYHVDFWAIFYWDGITTVRSYDKNLTFEVLVCETSRTSKKVFLLVVKISISIIFSNFFSCPWRHFGF